MPLFYDDFVKKIAENFEAALSEIQAGHNFDLGPEFEVAVCKMLRRALPQRFGICRGYVITLDGESAGDDIIIYERLRFPTLRSLDEDYSRKEKVPVEAVFAYIETKHTLEINGEGPSSLMKAIKQAAEVARVCNTRAAVPLTQITPSVNLATAKVEPIRGFPSIRNPMYTMVLSRFVRLNPGEAAATDDEGIEAALLSFNLRGGKPPDLLVAGHSHVGFPLSQSETEATMFSPFLPEGARLVGRTASKLAFGIGVVHLLWALDYIELGKMPWNKIVANGLGYEINMLEK
jgi:hypothetical protein